MDEPSASEPVPNIPNAPEPKRKRDNLYYFDIIVFEVESTLFRVPRNGFQVAGSFFEAVFSLPQPKGAMVEGSDDACPFLLHRISKVNFRSFLRVLYPFDGTATTYEEWVGALDLATMWDFKKIRRTCVIALTDLMISRNVVENILLAKKYRVKKWLRDGYLNLIQQREPLKIEEFHSLNLDLKTIERICAIRETRLSSYGMRREGTPVLKLLEVWITRIFADEIEGMEDFEDNLGSDEEMSRVSKKIKV